MVDSRITILGAGIQGVCLALALAHRGHPVTLFEANASALNATSSRNEGKIHLGFVYALDPSGETHRRMLESALCFSPLLDRWCHGLPWETMISDGFFYAIMPDSMAEPEQLYDSYQKLSKLLKDYSNDAICEPSYLGQELSWLWRKNDDFNSSPFSPGFPLRGFVETEERAVNPLSLASHLRRVIDAHPLIDLRCGVRVQSVARVAGGFQLDLSQGDEPATHSSELVANCTWAERSKLDEMVGLPNVIIKPCYRVKHSIIVETLSASGSLVPVTMVQGPYGDVVPRDDRQVYFSWYPECRTYFGMYPPRELWDDPEIARKVADRSLSTFEAFVPGLKGAKVVSSLAGIIMAEGATDIHDPQSSLHHRKNYGAIHRDGWWTIDTGKYTSAPLLAEQTAAEMCEEI